MKLRLTSLPLQLLVFLVLPLFGLLMLVALGGVALHQAEMQDLLVEHNNQIVPGVASSISEQLQQRQFALVGFAENTETLQNILETSADYLDILFDGGIALYDLDGELLAASSQSTNWNSVWAKLPHDTLVSNAGNVAYIPLVESDQNDVYVAITIPILQESQSSEDILDFQLVGVTSLSLLGLSDVLSSLHSSENVTVYIQTSNGLVLHHSEPAKIGQLLSVAPDDTTANEISGASYQTNAQGQDVIKTYSFIPNTDWILVHEERWKETISPMMRYSQAAPLVLIPGLLLTLGAVWFGIQRIVYPLQRLETQATHLTWGDYTAIEQNVGGIDDIKQLQSTLRHMVKRMQASQDGMRNYIAAITNAQEDERKRLAHELHDQTVQSLIALDHRQQMLKPFLSDDPKASTLLSDNRDTIAQTIDDLRRIVRAMRPIYLEELGLTPALDMLARDITFGDKITVHFEKSGTPQRLPHEHETALYRVAQESLNNAWQHSEATHIWISVCFEETGVVVSVRDNGKGFAAPKYATDLTGAGHQQFGIIGMYERASLIGAHLQIQSESGNGTTVKIRTPVVSMSS